MNTTTTEIAEALGVTEQAVRAACKRLMARGDLAPRRLRMWLLTPREARVVRAAMRPKKEA